MPAFHRAVDHILFQKALEQTACSDEGFEMWLKAPEKASKWTLSCDIFVVVIKLLFLKARIKLHAQEISL